MLLSLLVPNRLVLARAVLALLGKCISTFLALVNKKGLKGYVPKLVNANGDVKVILVLIVSGTDTGELFTVLKNEPPGWLRWSVALSNNIITALVWPASVPLLESVARPAVMLEPVTWLTNDALKGNSTPNPPGRAAPLAST